MKQQIENYHYLLFSMAQFRLFDDLEQDFALPTFIRGVSDQNIFASFFCPQMHQSNEVKVPIFPTYSEIPEKTQIVPNFEGYITHREEKKRTQSKQKKDYKKNICGYITKKIVREFLNPIYKTKVQSLCQKYSCDYSDCLEYYDKKIERITGPTHLDMLLNSSKQEPEMKRCFKQFFIWFLRHRYLRYLIMEGKMERKDIYVDYKNKTLLYLGSMDEDTERFLHQNELQSRSTSSIYNS